MYNYFSKKFSDYIIENSNKYLIFFIPGIELKEELDWYGYKRAEAFNKLSSVTPVMDTGSTFNE